MLWTGDPRRGLRLVKRSPFVSDVRQCTQDDPCDLCIAVTPAPVPLPEKVGLAWRVLFALTSMALGLVLGAGLLTCADVAADLIARAMGYLR